MRSRQVVVIGAGMAGLAAARELTGTANVVVVDKGRAVGGRVATRRVGPLRADLGAQFLTARTELGRRLVTEWQRAGVAEVWFRGEPDLAGPDDPDGHPRFRGTPVMRAIPEHLASGLDSVHTGVRVRRITTANGTWVVEADAGRTHVEFPAHALLCTAPVPQSLALLDAGEVELPHEVRTQLEAISYLPCWSVVADTDGPTSLPPRGALRLEDDGPLWWLTDVLAKGTSDVPGVVVHAQPGWSRDHLDDDPDEVGDTLLAAARTHLGTAARRRYVHRWRYALPVSEPVADDGIVTDVPAPLAFAGDAFVGGRVEGAIVSGHVTARRLLTTLG